MRNSRPSGFSRLGVVLILAFPAWSGVSQSVGSISGKVIDAKTKAPVPFATVFLANTMIGVIAKEDGSYSLQKIPNGKYDLTVSCVGYKLLTLPISFLGNEEKKDLSLSEAVEVLKEVVIKTSHVSPGDLRKFRIYFLGETTNASKCTITNIDEIDFNYDEDTRVLTAAASRPIEVENKALGFRVFYLLKKFELDLRNNIVKVAGIPRFEALPPRNESQQRHWIKERDRAYLGSLNHFMRSLKSQSLTKNYFEVDWEEKLTKEQKQANQKIGIPSDTESDFFATNESRLFARRPDSVIQLRIVYKREVPESGYPDKSFPWLGQTTYLKFKRSSLVIHENGYYENPLDFYLNGYLGWSSGIAELMPFEYQPTSKNKE